MLRYIQSSRLIAGAYTKSNRHLDDDQDQRCCRQGPAPSRAYPDKLVKNLLGATNAVGQRSKPDADKQAGGNCAPGSAHAVYSEHG